MLKYGKNINFNPRRLHPLNIDRQSIFLIPEGSNVLEIGCATGFMGNYLIKSRKCRVTGVEQRKEEARRAKKRLDRVIEGDIEDKSTYGKIQEKYDVILASALIQHLKNPLGVLIEWKKLLKKDGFVIITASNIAHWTTRLALFKGKFEYEDYGLLDDTHLRFFTIISFKKLLIDAGYSIDYFSIDPVGGGMPKISEILSKLLPGLFAYQMVLKAKPKK